MNCKQEADKYQGYLNGRGRHHPKYNGKYLRITRNVKSLLIENEIAVKHTEVTSAKLMIIYLQKKKNLKYTNCNI